MDAETKPWVRVLVYVGLAVLAVAAAVVAYLALQGAHPPMQGKWAGFGL